MKRVLAFAISATAIIVAGLGTAATADPRNLKAYCAAHRIDAGPGEDSDPSAEVRAAGGNTWRCMEGKALVCNLGASGAACERTSKYDARRRRAFTEFCHDNPDSNYISEAVSRGLASTWRCDNKTPVQMKKVPVDKLGYYSGSWHPLR